MKITTSALLMLATVFMLLPGRAQASVRVEAETGTLTDGAATATSQAGYSGTGYAGGFTTGHGLDTMTVTVPAAGYYDLWVRYATPYGKKYADLKVNGVTSQLYLSTTSPWDSVNAGPVLLNQGRTRLPSAGAGDTTTSTTSRSIL